MSVTVTYPKFRVRLVDDGDKSLAHLINPKGQKMGSGVPATDWEIVLWREFEVLRAENEALRAENRTLRDMLKMYDHEFAEVG